MKGDAPSWTPHCEQKENLLRVHVHEERVGGDFGYVIGKVWREGGREGGRKGEEEERGRERRVEGAGENEG